MVVVKAPQEGCIYTRGGSGVEGRRDCQEMGWCWFCYHSCLRRRGWIRHDLHQYYGRHGARQTRHSCYVA